MKDHPTLVIRGDPSDIGEVTTARFDLVAASDSKGGLNVTYNLRTGYITEGAGRLVQTLLSELDGIGQGANLGVYTNLGTGQSTWSIEAETWSGSNHQWGNGSDDPKLDASGSNESARRQLAVLAYWLRNTRPDSLPESVPGSDASIAKLEVGEHHENGLYETLTVVLEDPTINFQASRPSQADISITCIEAADLSESYDALVRGKRGN